MSLVSMDKTSRMAESSEASLKDHMQIIASAQVVCDITESKDRYLVANLDFPVWIGNPSIYIDICKIKKPDIV